jgi:hypothetical protein
MAYLCAAHPKALSSPPTDTDVNRLVLGGACEEESSELQICDSLCTIGWKGLRALGS